MNWWPRFSCLTISFSSFNGRFYGLNHHKLKGWVGSICAENLNTIENLRLWIWVCFVRCVFHDGAKFERTCLDALDNATIMKGSLYWALLWGLNCIQLLVSKGHYVIDPHIFSNPNFDSRLPWGCASSIGGRSSLVYSRSVFSSGLIMLTLKFPVVVYAQTFIIFFA